MSPSEPQRGAQAPWGRLAGMGIEYGAVVAAFTLIGWWVDRHWQIESHAGTLIGALLGLIGGTYNFVREALKATRSVQRQPRRPAERAPEARPDEPQDDGGNRRT